MTDRPHRDRGDDPARRASWPHRPRPVRVEAARVVRVEAGLRPYRPGGFVVRAERVGDRTIVHNYGHGGAGIALSWGTAELAAELALATGERHIAVIGAGAVGLATARVLRERGAEVTIHARDLPPATTSDVAGAHWSVGGLFDPVRVTNLDFLDQIEPAARAAHRRFAALDPARFGVRWVGNYQLSDEPLPSRCFIFSRTSPIRDLFPGARHLAPEDNPFATRHARWYSTMTIDVPTYLAALLADVAATGVEIERTELADLAAVTALPERTIVNCAGLGTLRLFGDPELIPLKGQVVLLEPQPEIDYTVLCDDLFMMPRREAIVLGATHDANVWSTLAVHEVTERLLRRHSALFACLQRSGG